MIVAAGASLKDALRSIRRHLLFRSLDKRVVALNKGRSFRTDDRKKSADLLQTIDKAIAKNPGDAALLLLMKAEVYQTAGFYTEAFDLLYACFEKDRSEANVVARRVSRLLTVIGFNRTGWESVQFTQPERSVTRTEFLNAILPKLEALKAALPHSPVMTETLRKRLMLLGNAANLVAFDEANFARRPTTDASASLIQSLIRDFDSSRKVDSLVRAHDVVDRKPLGTFKTNYIGAAALASAMAGQEAWKEKILAARGGKPPKSVLDIYRSAPTLIRHRAILSQKKLWNFVYDGDEALKRMVVRDMARSPEVSYLRSGKVARDTLTRSAMTKEYWDQTQRQELVSLIGERMPKRALTAQQFLTQASWLAQAGEWEGAAQAFERAERARGWTPTLDVAFSGRRSFLPVALVRSPEFDEAAFPYNDAAVQLTMVTAPATQPQRVLLACSDPRYFARYAETYVQSVRKSGSEVPIHFHVINPTDDTLRRHAALNARFGSLSLSTERLEVEKTTYYACVRFFRAPSFLRMLGCDILLTDIDVTYPRDPEPFLRDARVLEADAVMRFYDKVRVARSTVRGDLVYRYPRILPWSHVNAACLVLRNNPNGLAFADVVRAEMARHFEELMKHPGSGWWADQNALLAAYRTVRRDRPDIVVANVEDIGMPFGAFASSEDLSMYPAVGYNKAVFG